ncbi:MAG: metal-sensitive transcriptional regulator [Candidatus Dojkabacteria bacterium]
MTDSELKNNKDKASISVKKAHGTLNKILLMITEDKYCPDIIQQVDAAIGLLKSSKKTLLIGHLDHCVEHNMHEDKPKTIDELIRIFDLQ